MIVFSKIEQNFLLELSVVDTQVDLGKSKVGCDLNMGNSDQGILVYVSTFLPQHFAEISFDKFSNLFLSF